MLRFGVLLLGCVLFVASCATDQATEDLRRENAAIPGALPPPPPLNEHGGISW